MLWLIWKWVTHFLLHWWAIFIIKYISSLPKWSTTEKEIMKLLEDPFVAFLLCIFTLWTVLRHFWIYEWIYSFFKWYIGFFIYWFYRSQQIYRSMSLCKENIRFLLDPLAGKRYFRLKDWQKSLLKERDPFISNLLNKMESKFCSKNWILWASIEKYSHKKGVIKIYLYRSWNSEAKKVLDLDTTNILRSLDLSVEKYILEIEASNSYIFTITPKVDDSVYEVEKYIDSFCRDTMHLGYTREGEEITRKISFENSNSIAVYWKTGSWKTTATRTLLYSLYIKNPNYRFYVLDPKWDMSHFKNIERVSYAHDNNDIITMLERIQREMNWTSTYFNEHWLHNFQDYRDMSNKSQKFYLTFIFLEEFSLLLWSITDKVQKQRVIDITTNIAIGGRSIAFNLCFSLQMWLKSVIWSSQISEMLHPICFNISNTVGRIIFWEKTWYEVQNLWIWEGLVQQWHDYKKFKSFIVSKKSLEHMTQENKVVAKSDSELYLEHAKNVNSFSKKEALAFWITQSEFTELSSKLQDEWVVYKAPYNALFFVKEKDII